MEELARVVAAAIDVVCPRIAVVLVTPLPSDIFVRRLRQERERQKVSQAELARRIAEILQQNVDPSAVTY